MDRLIRSADNQHMRSQRVRFYEQKWIRFRERRGQVGLARVQPVGACQALALRTVAVTARIEGVTGKPAIGALLHVPAQRGGAACFDRRHHAAPGTVEVVSVGVPVGRAVEAENIRHLQRGAHRSGSGGHRTGIGYDAGYRLQRIQRAGGRAHFVGREAEVSGSGAQAPMAKQQLDGP